LTYSLVRQPGSRFNQPGFQIGINATVPTEANASAAWFHRATSTTRSTRRKGEGEEGREGSRARVGMACLAKEKVRRKRGKFKCKNFFKKQLVKDFIWTKS
jgi:hypothetical protein